MAKKPIFDNIAEENKILWRDRKRILGLPLSFTVYEVDEDRFTTRKGFLRTETDEILLYRILDVKMVRTLGQKICGVGTITLFSADQSHHTLEIKNVKHPEAVRKFLSKIVEKERAAKGITGREIFGTAGIGMDHDECDHDFTDVDGDGIPG
ncbi:MAG: PH domain-containing protein [Clostridia bacterium]|nr:PH domain-containing protein [Clostridia bacterium]